MTFYFQRKIALAQSSGIEDFGQPKWDLVLCLMLAWIVCFFCLIKGIKSTGKVTAVLELCSIRKPQRCPILNNAKKCVITFEFFVHIIDWYYFC